MVDRLRKLASSPLFVTSVLFLLAIQYVGYHGEFPINDDWIFVRQIEAFFLYQIELSAAIDPSFVAQGVLGYAWGKFFGVSFESMRILTLGITFVLTFVAHRILTLLKVSKRIKFISLLLIVFNPLVFTSAFTFMTENYFLVFYAFALFYYLKAVREDSLLAVLFGSLFTGFAILVRQPGVVLFIAYLLTLIYQKKFSLKKLLIALIPIIASFWVFVVWPRFFEDSVTGGTQSLFSNLIGFNDLGSRLYMMFLAIPYFAFFLLPFLFNFPNLRQIPTWVKLVGLVAVFYISNEIFLKDVFPVGSVLYVEGLHGKSNFRANLNLFDNIPFKEFLSLLISLGLVRFAVLLEHRKKLDSTSAFLLLCFLGSFFINLFGNDFYDRYLIPSFVSLLLFFVYSYKGKFEFGTKFQVGLIALVILMTVFLQQEYLANTRLRWKQALALQWDTGYVNSIFVDGTYAKYSVAKKRKNYKGDVSGEPAGKIECYVQKYTFDNDSYVFKFVDWVDTTTKNIVENPEVFRAKRKRGIPKLKKHLDEVLYNDEYYSPMYNLVGKQAFVGSWCNAKGE